MKKLIGVLATAALTVGMAMSAFASNSSGTYLYYDSALTSAAPSHAQGCIGSVETDTGATTTNIDVNLKTTTYNGVTGEITSMTLNGETVPASNSIISFENVSNDVIASNGAVAVSVTISYGGHENDLTNLYLAVGTED